LRVNDYDLYQTPTYVRG